MYLENRAAFPLNLSPQLTWKDDPDAAKMEQAARCANILGAAARFCNSLRANVLVPDVFHTKVRGNIDLRCGVGVSEVRDCVGNLAAPLPLGSPWNRRRRCSTTRW